MKKPGNNSSKMWLSISIFCMLGTVVMLFSGETVLTSIVSSTFYLLSAVVTWKIYKKKINHSDIKVNSIKFNKHNTNLDYPSINEEDSLITTSTVSELVLDDSKNDQSQNMFTGLNHRNKTDQDNINRNRFDEEYITALLLNRYRKPGKIYKNNSDYPIWFIQSLGITDPYNRYVKLISSGYLEEASIDLKLMNLLKKDLEEICSRLDLPRTGNKIDLVNRIIKVPNFEKETTHYVGITSEYVLSDLGKEWLNNNSDLIRLKNDYGLNPNRYIEIRNYLLNDGLNPTFEQISIIIRQENIQKNLDNYDYYLVSNEFRLLAEDYLVLSDRSNALNSLISSIIFKFSGLSYYGNIDSDSQIFGYLQNFKILLDFDPVEIKSAFAQITSSINLPYQKYPFTVMEAMIEEYYRTGDIQFEKFVRFANRAPYITEYGEYWKDPSSIYNF